VLDDEADRTDVDVTSGEPRAERVNDGFRGLARRAVASVASPRPGRVDEPAAAQLANAEFYRYALKYKPPQQKY
jgi:glucosamine-6-phosphate deaminase